MKRNMGFLPFRNLILNILPEYIAEELAEHRKVHPKVYRPSTILFTDVVNFSLFSKHLDPGSLIDQLNFYFSLYDKVMEEFAIEKIKDYRGLVHGRIRYSEQETFPRRGLLPCCPHNPQPHGEDQRQTGEDL